MCIRDSHFYFYIGIVGGPCEGQCKPLATSQRIHLLSKRGRLPGGCAQVAKYVNTCRTYAEMRGHTETMTYTDTDTHSQTH
eukprot:3966379-Alexandrium_andersonii.AAC.1